MSLGVKQKLSRLQREIRRGLLFKRDISLLGFKTGVCVLSLGGGI